MGLKKILSSIVLAGTLAISGCNEQKEHVEGKISKITTNDLNYIDTKGFGSSNTIPVQVNVLEIDRSGVKYEMVLTGPHNLKEGDSISADYILDDKVTAEEIWNRLYSPSGTINSPKVSFYGDGYITDLKKK